MHQIGGSIQGNHGSSPKPAETPKLAEMTMWLPQGPPP